MIQKAIAVILHVDRQEFKEFARHMDRGTFKLLAARLSELGQDMEDTLTKFVDIPPIVIASNVFPYLDNRTDWNNFSLVNKDIKNAATNHKQLEPPWPEGQLMNERIKEYSSRLPAFSPNGDSIAHGDEEGNIYLWNRTKGLVANWQGADNDEWYDYLRVDNLIFSPDSNLLVSVGIENSSSIVKIWDLANDNRCLREWTQTIIHAQTVVLSVAFSPDGQVIASPGGPSPVYLRNVSDGTTTRLITHTLGAVFSVAFSPDGGTLALGGMAVGGSERSVELWKLDSADDTCFILEGHLGPVIGLAYSPDGTLLASAAENNNTIKLWDVATRQCVQTFKGHTRSGRSLSFTPDGNFLASGGYDYTIRLWSIASGDCIETINTSVQNANKVQFSPDGGKLLTNEGSNIRLRAMDADALEKLKKEREDLMKLNAEQLHQALAENGIEFDSVSPKGALVDLLVDDLDQNERKEILMRCNGGGTPASRSSVSIAGS
jgi:Tol biopolymer transport system component